MGNRVLRTSVWGLSGLAVFGLAWLGMTGCQATSSLPVLQSSTTENASKTAPGEAVVPARRTGGVSLSREPHVGSPEILSLWSNFMMHPDQRILPELTQDWFQIKCAKGQVSPADQGMGLPLYVGWNGRLENEAAGKIQIYVDSLKVNEAPELLAGQALSEVSLKVLLDRPVPEQPLITFSGDQSCLYFYVQDAAYRFYVRGVDGHGNESSLVGPIVASIFQMVKQEDLTSVASRDMSIAQSLPESPDQLRLPWVPLQIGLPELHDQKNPDDLRNMTVEFHKILRGLRYLTHLYVDDQGVSKKVPIPHYVNGTSVVYQDVDPFDYFSMIWGKPDGAASGRHRLMTYRYNDACEFSVENAKVEACRRGDVIVLYPQYMNHEDDFRRGVILMHEASHKGRHEGGVGPHSCGRGGDVGPGSYTAGISVLRKVIEHSQNCFERASAYVQMVSICSLNVVSSREFYQRHCHSGTCDSDWANLLKDLGCVEMEQIVNPQGECFPGRNEIVSPSVCEL